MCGIAAVFGVRGATESLAVLRAMTDRMVHRGPDDEGFEADGVSGLGMRRLSIIDVGGGHQPICNEDATIWLVLNGEIYNFVELRAELIDRGHRFRTQSDAEVIIHLYEDRGVEALSALNGMFGFALWDKRKNVGFVARDRLGVKPVFMAATPDRVVFASDLHAIRTAVDARPKRSALLKYLALGYVPSPDSLFEGITKLPPAHYAWIENGVVSVKKYWQVEAIGTWSGRPDQAREQLDALLHDAVRLQMRSDVPVGIFLSGGLDSSAVAAMAAGTTREPLRTLTVEFAGKGGEDPRFARMVATQYGTRHLEVRCDAAEGMASLCDLIGRLDEPVADSAMIPTFILSEAARRQGIKVLLSGAGGDEIFGGYGRHGRPASGDPDWLAAALRGPIGGAVGALVGLMDRDLGVRLADERLGWAVGISGTSLGMYEQILRRPDDFREMVDGVHGYFEALPARRHQHGHAYGGMLTDLDTYLVDDVLSLSDKATMAASVEGRVPLLDHRIVELAYSLPAEVNLLDGRPKGLFTTVLESYLPPELTRRSKEGFNAPMQAWITGGAENAFEADLLRNPAPLVTDLIDIARLRERLAPGARSKRTAETVFALYVLNRWAWTHMDRAS